jgi:hypothetical protein
MQVQKYPAFDRRASHLQCQKRSIIFFYAENKIILRKDTLPVTLKSWDPVAETVRHAHALDAKNVLAIRYHFNLDESPHPNAQSPLRIIIVDKMK